MKTSVSNKSPKLYQQMSSNYIIWTRKLSWMLSIMRETNSKTHSNQMQKHLVQTNQIQVNCIDLARGEFLCVTILPNFGLDLTLYIRFGIKKYRKWPKIDDFYFFSSSLHTFQYKIIENTWKWDKKIGCLISIKHAVPK